MSTALSFAQEILGRIVELESNLQDRDQTIETNDRKYHALLGSIAQQDGEAMARIDALERELMKWRGPPPPQQYHAAPPPLPPPPPPRALLATHKVPGESSRSDMPAKGATCKGCGLYIRAVDSVHPGFIPWKEHHKVCEAPRRFCQGCGGEVKGSFTSHNKTCCRICKKCGVGVYGSFSEHNKACGENFVFD